MFRALAARRGAAYAVAACLLAACLPGLLFVAPSEDITVLLPDDGSQVADDLALLSCAPFAADVAVTIVSPTRDDARALGEIASRAAEALPGPLVSGVVRGPEDPDPAALVEALAARIPYLLRPFDLPRVAGRLEPEAVAQALDRNLRELLSPFGAGIKQVVRLDPLRLREIVLERLSAFAGAGARTAAGFPVDADAGRLLMVVKTPVPITDAAKAAALIEHVRGVLDAALPEGYEAEIVSGHRYTLANSRVVRSDVFFVLVLSLSALAALFALFVRRAQALWVFALPGACLIAAVAGTALVYGSVSAIVMGFGALVVGICVDMGLHVFFALAEPARRTGAALDRVARPLVFSALTSGAAFVALLASALPGIRQLAVFSLCGLAAALILALTVLPLLAQRTRPIISSASSGSLPRAGRVLLPLFAAAAALLAAAGTTVGFEGDIRTLSFRPERLVELEASFTRTWGGMRERAVVFALGNDRQQALERNDAVFAALARNALQAEALSLSPVLPARATQQADAAAWREFWTPERIETARERIRAAAADLPFARNAFAPFFELVRGPRAGYADQALYRALGVEGLLQELMARTPDGPAAMTLVADTAKMRALFARHFGDDPGVRYLSRSRLGERLSSALKRDFFTFITLSVCLVGLIVLALFRNLRDTAAALAPPAFGLIAVLGLFGLMGRDLGLFHIVALPLVVGLGADYGIFMVHRARGLAGELTGRAVFVSALTTIAALGALSLAGHPAMAALGATVLFGVGAAAACALFAVPSLVALWGRTP